MIRNFPRPWTVHETEGSFIVRDANGQALAYVHGGDGESKARFANALTRDEARRHRHQHRQAL